MFTAGLDNFIIPKVPTPRRTPLAASNNNSDRRPLPPLPSASTIRLPSFPNFASPSFADPPLYRFEGPQWIPAFHHPNSPYVPWPSPVRRRILPALSPSPVCPSSPFIRSGAVAPEPWASSTLSHTHDNSRQEGLLSSWKSFKDSMNKRVRTIVARFGKSRPRLGILCMNHDMLCTFDDTDTTAVVQPNAIRSILAMPCDSLASLISSDSTTLVAWLAERRATAPCVIEDPMTVDEYELMGSWFDLRHCDRGWACGVQDCGIHSIGGSPYATSECPNGLRRAMPVDDADMSVARPPSRSHPLPRLPCQSFDIHPPRETRSANLKGDHEAGGRTFN